MNKQIIAVFGIVAVIVVLVFGLTAFSSKDDIANKTSELSSSSDVGGHHGPSVTDESLFNSLVGKPAPDFALESYDGKQINLKDLKGKRVVLFFTEGLMCYPSCWNQMVAFAKDSAFNNNDTITLSISVDRREDWKEAIDKMPELSSAIVLFDTNKQVSNAYGVLSLGSSMHKGQFPGHTYLIVDRDGIVRFIEDDPQMGVRNDKLKTELEKLK